MTTFKITDKNHPLYARAFPEHTAFTRYTATTAAVEYVPLLVGAGVVKFFARCNLEAVRVPNMTDLDYCYPQPCRAIVLWRPVVTLTPDMAASVNFAAGVEIRVAA